MAIEGEEAGEVVKEAIGGVEKEAGRDPLKGFIWRLILELDWLFISEEIILEMLIKLDKICMTNTSYSIMGLFFFIFTKN